MSDKCPTCERFLFDCKVSCRAYPACECGRRYSRITAPPRDVQGTFICPICGGYTQHWHGPTEICQWLVNQAATFNLSVEVFDRTAHKDTIDYLHSARDKFRRFVEEMGMLKGMDFAWQLWCERPGADEEFKRVEALAPSAAQPPLPVHYDSRNREHERIAVIAARDAGFKDRHWSALFHEHGPDQSSYTRPNVETDNFIRLLLERFSAQPAALASPAQPDARLMARIHMFICEAIFSDEGADGDRGLALLRETGFDINSWPRIYDDAALASQVNETPAVATKPGAL